MPNIRIAYSPERETKNCIRFRPAEAPENEGLEHMTVYLPKRLLKDLRYSEEKHLTLTVSVD